MAALPAEKIVIRKRSQSDGWSQDPARVWEEAVQGIDRSAQEERDGSAEMLQTQFRGWLWFGDSLSS